MLITQKHKYALRAVFELARRERSTPVKLGDIAEAQAIPIRFLEVIMSRLRHHGLVVSKRGFTGGYRLAKPANRISVGDVFRTLEAPGDPQRCNACANREDCPLTERCVFLPLWNQVQDAVTGIYDGTTLADLVQSDLLQNPDRAAG